MMDLYKKHQCNILGLKSTNIADVNKFGAISGVMSRDDPEDDGAGQWTANFSAVLSVYPQRLRAFVE